MNEAAAVCVACSAGRWIQFCPCVTFAPPRTDGFGLTLQRKECSQVPSIDGIFNCMVAPQTFCTTYPTQFYTFQIIAGVRCCIMMV